MTKHKPGESSGERKWRRLVEYKNKVMKDAHIDPHKFGKRVGEHISREVSKFSDKEIEEAMKIGMLIGNRLEPEDGVSYEEVAALLSADENNLSFEGIPEEYTKDDVYIPKIDRLLHVLKQVMFDFLFNTTLEPHEQKIVVKCHTSGCQRDKKG